MKRNRTTTSGKTRWRCTVCGASVTKTRSDISNAAVFRSFIEHCTSTTSLQQTALTAGVSLSTIKRRFSWCWLVEIPDPMIGHTGRIYDQIFLDGTYTAGGCLIVAATLDHVLAWHWCKRETTHAYQQLLERIPAPAIAVIDGGQGAASAIKKCWPSTVIQRCLVHAQRVARRYTTTRPRTDAGRTIYQLARNLTAITTCDQAARWATQLHEYANIYHDWMNEKTYSTDPLTQHHHWSWTHEHTRKAYNSLNYLWRNNPLFAYLDPPANVVDAKRVKATTNSLERGITHN